ncbi:MAG: metallophosphoesterase [Halobacteriaceae archaeon]
MGDPEWARCLDRACLVGDALVLADLHVGRAAGSNVAMPVDERGDLTGRLAALLDAHDPGTVVFAGDVLHAFDSVPDGAGETVAALESLVADAGADLVVTPGNHDGMLDAVTEAPTPAAHRLPDGTVVCHGHAVPDADAGRYVVGHEHPALVVEGARHPCFLYGPGVHDGADLLVVPAFSQLAAGTVVNDLSAADTLSPLLGDLGACRPVVVTGDGPLPFPPLRELRPFL